MPTEVHQAILAELKTKIQPEHSATMPPELQTLCDELHGRNKPKKLLYAGKLREEIKLDTFVIISKKSK